MWRRGCRHRPLPRAAPGIRRRDRADFDGLVGEFQKRLVTVTEHGTWLTGPVEKTLWIRRNPDDTFLVFSGTCPHMNCTVNLTAAKTFECPCHMSSFDAEGKVTSMPAPRPLDTLEYRVSTEGELSVQYQNFRKALTTKELVPAS